MKLLRLICALAVTAGFTAAAQQIDPISQAVINGYTEVIKENPKDYEALYERAAQYHQNGMYAQACQDLEAAIALTPQKNTQLREHEYSLLAASEMASANDEKALAAVDNALNINPANYSNVYRKGMILLNLNRNDEAYRAFSSMQSLKSRSQEAYYGMAKACVRKGQLEEANTLIKEVESAAPTNPLTFTRIGNIYAEMAQPETAAANYIIAMAMDSNGNSGLQELFDLSEKNYKAVASALDFAADKADNKGLMLLLKGTIAKKGGQFNDAEQAFAGLLKYDDGQTASTYASLAECRLGLNELPTASEAVNKAISLNPSSAYYTLKSKIELAMENPRSAIADGNDAIKKDGNNVDALITSAAAYIAAGEADNAINLLNQAIMLEPDNLMALLFRAYSNQELKHNAKSAIGDYNRIILETPESFPNITIQALARAKTGKKIDADEQIKSALSNNPNPDDLFWGAVYYAQTGDLERSKALAEQAIFDGFYNKHLLFSSQLPWLNLKPISHLMK